MPCSAVGGFDVFTDPGTTDSESEESESHGKGKGRIRVGDDYQAKLPVCMTHTQRRLVEDQPEKGMLTWSPSLLSDSEVNRYVSKAVETYGYSQEQALAMLFWHKHCMARATQDLANFTPVPSEWSEGDKILFEEAFKIQGKQFAKIQKNLPEKSIKSLVQHYFSRDRAAMVAKQSKKQGMEKEMQNRGMEEDHMVESDVPALPKSCDEGKVYQRMLGSYSPLPTLARRGETRAQGQGYTGHRGI